MDEIFHWNDERKSVRQKLRNQHEADDRIIEMAEFFGGDTSHDIEQRRDVYQNINNEKNYFFLSFDKGDKLIELEIHGGLKISINNLKLEFQKDINQYLKEFEKIGEVYSEIEEGSFLFENLKMNIANSESMGGDGNGLGYFYASKSIIHLKE